MKRAKTWLIFSLLFVLALSLAACGSGSETASGGNSGGDQTASGGRSGGNQAAGGENSGVSDRVYKWNLGTIHLDPQSLKDYNSYGYGIVKFIELVKEKTNGRVEITPFFGSVLGGDQELFQSAKAGEIVFYGRPLPGADSRFGAWGLPFLFTGHEHVRKTWSNPDGELFKLSQSWLADHDLQLLAVGVGSFRGIANGVRPIARPEDMKGIKIRIVESPSDRAFWEPISDPTPMPFGDVYMALETKAIDGVEFHSTGVIGQQYYNLIEYFTDINWTISAAANIIVPHKLWNELPEDLQQAVTEAAWEAMDYQAEIEKADTEKALGELAAKGMEIYEMTPEDLQAWKDYANSLADKYKEIVGPEVYDAVMQAVQ
jgi:TRAP-type C4-dicarboxylate transport system substrate-binding protein